jgi:serine/threonine protein kinase KIN1/2
MFTRSYTLIHETRVARGAAIQTLFHHPYICDMLDVVRTNFHWYYILEYVAGDTLIDLLSTRKKLKESQARELCRQIASALDYCHRNSFAYRALSMENVMITKSGRAVLVGFTGGNLFSYRRHLRSVYGNDSPAFYYQPPEVLSGERYTGPEVDVWAFGIVMFAMVCGHVPFNGAENLAVLRARLKEGSIVYPSSLSAGMYLLSF